MNPDTTVAIALIAASVVALVWHYARRLAAAWRATNARIDAVIADVCEGVHDADDAHRLAHGYPPKEQGDLGPIDYRRDRAQLRADLVQFERTGVIR